MTIPDKLKSKWIALRSPGDADRIAEKTQGVTPDYINRSIRSGKCRDEVFKVIAEFYEEKANLIKEYL